MKISGYNNFSALGEKSNKEDFGGNCFIDPPVDSHINVSSISSFSIFSDHSVFIDKEGQGFAFGYNKDFRIAKSLPKKILRNESKLKFGQEDSSFKLISAVCGEYYTLYLFTDENAKNDQLVYSSSYFKDSSIVINTNTHTPKFLFGGFDTAAVIDTEGLIYIIKNNFFTSGKTVTPVKLPNGNRAISIAFCFPFIFVLSSFGKIFRSPITAPSKLSFSECIEFEGKMISEISGTYKHCLAVSQEGKAYSYGNNEFGQLGIEINNTSNFMEITSLSKYKIVSVSAGFNHSLFLTNEGTVIGCGSNEYGQLLLKFDLGKKLFFSPVETTVKCASHIIAGNCLSAVFTDEELPQNTPNMPVRDDISELVDKLRSKNDEMRELREEIDRLKDENNRLHSEIELIHDNNVFLQPEAGVDRAAREESGNAASQVIHQEIDDDAGGLADKSKSKNDVNPFITQESNQSENVEGKDENKNDANPFIKPESNQSENVERKDASEIDANPFIAQESNQSENVERKEASEIDANPFIMQESDQSDNVEGKESA